MTVESATEQLEEAVAQQAAEQQEKLLDEE
jgi:hypothetical protein